MTSVASELHSSSSASLARRIVHFVKTNTSTRLHLPLRNNTSDDEMIAIIGKIEGAKLGSSAEYHRQILSSWVDCTRVQRVSSL